MDTMLVPDSSAIADYIHLSKYARYVPELKRRELYSETIDRVETMHVSRYSKIQDDIRWAFDFVRQKKVLPSMRALQFAGTAIERNNARLYNCAFSLCDRTRFFQEVMFLLLCGTGVGFSVQFEHVEQLPALGRIDRDIVKHYAVDDTIEGWANALGKLITSYTKGFYIEFAYNKIRAKGAPLKTSGGKAPGHLPLKKALDSIRKILDGAQGRKLRPIECYRIVCLAAEAVLSGGIRRSATLCLFSPDDGEMLNAKTGDWMSKYPEFQNSNNSVVLDRKEAKWRQFKRIIERTREWGEPGFFFTNDVDTGVNPCVEIGLNPILVIDEDTRHIVETLFESKGETPPKMKDGERYTGWGFCNLCEINAAKFEVEKDFYDAARAAAIIGTLQAGYTDFPYLGWVSEVVARREALLGIGMTGMMDASAISLNPEYQRKAVEVVLETNQEFAKKLGIRTAARTTCVKPSGTTSLELGCVGSGIHGHPAHRYLRRVVANELEPVFQFFKSINPHQCERKPNGDWVVTFPVQAPDSAVLVSSMTAIQFLQRVLGTQKNWVLPGTARPRSSPGINHNVSNTVMVLPDEWDVVAEFLWANREFFTGVSMLGNDGDKKYEYAPREAIINQADEAKWKYLIENYKPVDYGLMVEGDDATNLKGEVACAGGSCELV